MIGLTLLVATTLAAAPAPAAPAPDPVEAGARLATLDTDHDGRWSKAEWLAGGRRERGFDRLDADHDGFVTTDELRAGMATMRAAREADMPLPPPE